MLQSTLNFNGLPLKARLAIVMFAASGAMTLAWALISQSFSSPVRFLLLLALAVGTARQKFRLYKDSSISFLTTVILLAILVAGTTEALLIAVCGVSVQTYFPGRKLVLYRLFFNAGMIAVTVKASCWIYSFCMAHGGLPNQLVAVVAASSVYYLGNSVFVSVMIAFSTQVRVFQLWHSHFASSAPSFMMAGLLSLLASEVTMRLPETAMLLLVIPVVISSYYFSLRLVETRA